MEVGSTPGERPLRLLLIEDSPADAELIEALLAHRDDVRFAMAVAPTLADGLAWLSQRTPQLILLDLTLPGSERLETLRAVRNRCPFVPVVVMTAQDEKGLGQVAVQQGAQDFLVKGPLTSDRLARALLFAIERAARAEAWALRDPLTGLARTGLLVERAGEALARAEATKRLVALLALGLVDFGTVDRRFGPHSGEELLFGVAERLCEVFPPPTPVGRVGVDEFAVVLEGLVRPSNAERAGQRLLGALAPEFKLGADRFRVAGCVGIALGRSPADGPDLLDRARAALADQRRFGQGIRLA